MKKVIINVIEYKTAVYIENLSPASVETVVNIVSSFIVGDIHVYLSACSFI